jgi:hypothetical protein
MEDEELTSGVGQIEVDIEEPLPAIEDVIQGDELSATLLVLGAIILEDSGNTPPVRCSVGQSVIVVIGPGG